MEITIQNYYYFCLLLVVVYFYVVQVLLLYRTGERPLKCYSLGTKTRLNPAVPPVRLKW
jgi:hypothetical protein